MRLGIGAHNPTCVEEPPAVVTFFNTGEEFAVGCDVFQNRRIDLESGFAGQENTGDFVVLEREGGLLDGKRNDVTAESVAADGFVGIRAGSA